MVWYFLLALLVLILVLGFSKRRKKTSLPAVVSKIDHRYVKITEDDHGELTSTFNLTFTDSVTNVPHLIVVDIVTAAYRKFKKEKSSMSGGPRIVQIAWKIFDEQGGVIKEVDEFLNTDVTETSTVLGDFLADCNKVKCMVGHNIRYKQGVIEANMRRLKVAKSFSMPHICTMQSSKGLLKMQVRPGSEQYKAPSLKELVLFLFYYPGIYPEMKQDDADYCVSYTSRCYFELKERGLID